MKSYAITATFEVHEDDMASENHADYRATIVAALDHFQRSRKATAEDKRRCDKMLEDCNRNL